MSLGLKESASDDFIAGPFLSILFVTGVQPWQLHTADVLSEQLFICLFKHPSGDLSVALKKKRSQELCSWERPRSTGGGQGELLLPFTADMHLQHLCQKKKGIDCLNCFGKKCRELSVEMAPLFAFPVVVVCTGTLGTAAGVAFWFLEQYCTMRVFCLCGEVRAAT